MKNKIEVILKNKKEVMKAFKFIATILTLTLISNFGWSQCPNGLSITEFVYDVSNASSLNESTGGGEYFILSNNTLSAIDISGEQFDNDGDLADDNGLVISPGAMLNVPANGCLIVATTSQSNWEIEYGPVSATSCTYYDSSGDGAWQGLTNSGGNIGLSGACNNGTYTDLVSQGEAVLWDGSAFVAGGIVSIHPSVGPQTHVPGSGISIPDCDISIISTTNISSCSNAGTPNDPADDTFLIDVTITFANPPTVGTLDLTGAATASVPVGSLDSPTSHSFPSLTLSANGLPFSFTASFSDDSGCDLGPSIEGTAPIACSVVTAPCTPPTFDAVAVCTAVMTQAGVGEYFIEITNISATDFDLTAGSFTADETDGATIYLGPFMHSGTGTEMVSVSLTDNTMVDCSTEVVVSEVICGYEVAMGNSSDGSVDAELHASGPACDCDDAGDMGAGFILAQANPGSFDPATTTMVYVLTDGAGSILQFNNTGLFTDLDNGAYQVYPYNVLNTDLGTFSISVNDNISTVDTNDGCFLACAQPAAYSLECACVCMIANVMVSPTCNVDAAGDLDGLYCVEVSFDVDIPLSDAYMIEVNGVEFGPFDYVSGTTQTLCDPSFLGIGTTNVAVVVTDAASVTANMCMAMTTFDEDVCVDAAFFCGIEIISSESSCNLDGTFNVDVCFSHTQGLSPTVSFLVDGSLALANVATTGGLQCVSVPAGTGVGSGSVTVEIYEATQTDVAISEIHYDNIGTDVDEGIEIYGSAGVNLAGFEIYLYNGSNGDIYGGSPIALTGIIPNGGSGCGALHFPISGLQNGPDDAIALVDANGNIVEFISYEGAVVANSGPAMGMTSADVGVAESTTGSGTSIQLTDAGWILASTRSFGSINDNLSCPQVNVVCENVFEEDVIECDIECGYLACNNRVQVSLGTDCEQCITPDMVLEGTYPIGYENYDVVITDTAADTIVSPAGCVGLKYAGMELMVSVACGGNSCWGTLVVEDKLPPQLTNCDAIQADLEAQYGASIQCSDLNEDWDITVSLIDSIIVECNSDFTVSTVQGLTGDMCGEDYKWTRTYTIDYPSAHGGREVVDACVVSLPVTSIGLDDIICPADQILGCRTSDSSPDAIYASYLPDTTAAYSNTQSYPYVINTAGDTIRLSSEHCNILSSHTDTELPVCQFQRKIVRKWTFIDWCTSQIKTCDQIIKLTDDAAMVCVAPPEFDIAIGSHCMIDSTVLPTSLPFGDLVIYSGCANVVDTTIYYKAKAVNREAINDLPFTLEAIKNADGTFTIPPIEVPFDSIWLKYEYTNACGESCSSFTEARVIDNTPPTPICNPDIAISFSDLEKGDDGLVKIFADAFDAGSHDNSCGPVYFKIVRQAELNNSTDGYWNNSGPHGGPDYTVPPISNINRFCNSANGDDFGDVTLNGSELVSTGNQFWFDDHIKLCCTDDNFNVMMRVFDVDPGDGPVDPRRMHSEPTQITGTTEVIDNDLYGHFNDCWVELSVQDKTQILGACQSLSLYCDEYPDNPMDNAPEINMLCSDDRVNLFSSDLADIAQCGNGLVIRQWFARKSSGDTAKVCSQSIVLQSRAFDPYSIQWPKQYVDGAETGRRLYQDSLGVCLDSTYQVPMGGALDCSADQNSCEPTWDGVACSLIGLSSADDTLFVDGDACMKIIRRWSVIDWCIYNENSGADNYNNSDSFEAVLDDCEESCDADNVYFRYTNVDIDGYYTYEQVLKIVDDQAPVLSGCDNKVRGLTEGCTLQLNINKTAADGIGCGQSFLKWIAILQDTSGNTLGTYPGVTDSPGTYEVETRAVPPGIYNVTWIVEDACGNESTCVEQYTVVDAKAPTPLCVRDLSTVLMPSTGSLEIWAVDYDLKSEDNCSTPIFSFSADTIQAGLTLTCDDMDGFAAKSFSYQVYVFDEAGNADFCVVTLRVDAKDICGGDGEGGSAAIIQGYISTESGDMVEDAQAMVNAALPEYPVMMMTEGNGEFAFPNNPFAYDYDVLIGKDGDDVNGVSTLDIVLIQKHILGLKSLDSPYKVIAADANNDQRVSASDLVHIRKLILGVTNEFPNNTSWRFVDADQTFQSLYNPWPFVEVINIGNLNSDMMEEDFVGVKVGDVNGNAAANSLHQAEVRSSGTLTFQFEDKVVSAGEEFSVDFSADNFEQVQGYQMTLAHPGLKHLAVTGQAIDMNAENVASFDDLLTMSWDNEQSVDGDEVLFTLHFRAEADLKLSEVVAINSRKTTAEAYIGESLSIYDIGLSTYEGEGVNTIAESLFELHQNQPNPFVTETTISFVLPEANEATITIMDVTGKLIMKISDIYEKGYNEISLRSDEIQTTGVIYYQLESGKHVATKKMIIMN